MKFENFILSLPNFLPDEACDDLINLFHQTDTDVEKSEIAWKDNNKAPERSDITFGGREMLREMQCFDEKGNRSNAVALFRQTLNNALNIYLDKAPILKQKVADGLGYFNTDPYKWQKTEIGGGFHRWHYENSLDKKRELTWTLYLNDVEEGGETEFLYQHTRIKAQKGLFTIFPANWTHTHRGNPPISNVKYIGTGWYIWKFNELTLHNNGVEFDPETFGP